MGNPIKGKIFFLGQSTRKITFLAYQLAQIKVILAICGGQRITLNEMIDVKHKCRARPATISF
jgi:hypothetical protein